MSGWPGSNRPWRQAQGPRCQAIQPIDERQVMASKARTPNREPDASACRGIRRPDFLTPNEFGSDLEGWPGWPKSIASNALASPGAEGRRGPNVAALRLSWQSCLGGFSRIEALPLAFPLRTGTRHFSSESERWVTKSRWSERPAMSGG